MARVFAGLANLQVIQVLTQVLAGLWPGTDTLPIHRLGCELVDEIKYSERVKTFEMVEDEVGDAGKGEGKGRVDETGRGWKYLKVRIQVSC